MIVFDPTDETNKIVRLRYRQSCRLMHLNERATPSGFSSFIGKVGTDWHSRFVKSSRDLERSQRLPVTHVCEYVHVWMQVRCLSRMSRKWVTFYPRSDSLTGRDRTAPTEPDVLEEKHGRKVRRRGRNGTGGRVAAKKGGEKKTPS